MEGIRKFNEKKIEFKKSQEEDLKQAKKDGKKILYLERCFCCDTHQMHTKHKEEKYISMASEFKSYVASKCGADFCVFENVLDDCFWKQGCFDVWTEKLNKKYTAKRPEKNGLICIFDKNKMGYWPAFKWITDELKEVCKEDDGDEDDNKKKGGMNMGFMQRIQSELQEQVEEAENN